MHDEALEFAARVNDVYGPFDRGLECGSLNVNGSVREVIDSRSYFGVDVIAGAGVDKVADFAEFTADDVNDLVVCCEVLEHSNNIDGIIESAHANLKPGGLFLITCATDGRAPHGVNGGSVGSEYYENVSEGEMRVELLGLFEILELEVHAKRGDIYVLAKKVDDGD